MRQRRSQIKSFPTRLPMDPRRPLAVESSGRFAALDFCVTPAIPLRPQPARWSALSDTSRLPSVRSAQHCQPNLRLPRSAQEENRSGLLAEAVSAIIILQYPLKTMTYRRESNLISCFIEVSQYSCFTLFQAPVCYPEANVDLDVDLSVDPTWQT